VSACHRSRQRRVNWNIKAKIPRQSKQKRYAHQQTDIACGKYGRRQTAYSRCTSAAAFYERWLFFYFSLDRDLSPNYTWLDTTRHVRRVEPMHFGCVELVEQHSSTRSTQRARLARLARHDGLDSLDTSSSTGSTGSTRNLVCCVVFIKLYYVSYSLI